jgi:hypothetical protein
MERQLNNLQNGWRRRSTRPRLPLNPALNPFPLLGITTTCLLVMVLVALRSEPHRQVLLPTAATLSGVAAPVCWRAHIELILVNRMRDRQQWETALNAVEAILRRADLCADERQGLRQPLLALRYELLFAHNLDPLVPAAQSAQLHAYHELRATAAALGSPPLAPLDIADRAYASGGFLLEVRALEAAWQQGSFGLHDQARLRQYASALYNLGYWWTQKPGPEYNEGLVFLATSAAIDQRYGIGSGAANQRLTAMFGDDAMLWPLPEASPLLAP